MTRFETATIATLITCGVLFALAIPEPAASDPPPRTITITDGDTLRLNGSPVRLYGIDAPERAQTCLDDHRRTYACGVMSAGTLRAMIARDPNVTCEGQDRDRYGRLVAVCKNSGGDLGARLVAQGWATAYRQYGGKVYADREAAAKAERLGMWAGTFVNPSDWRKGIRQ